MEDESINNTAENTVHKFQLDKLEEIPDAVKSIKEATKLFKPLRRSIYLDRKHKVPTEDDIFVCECIKSSEASATQLMDNSISFDCKEKCINRFISTECDEGTCPCGDLCQNKKFQHNT